MEINTLTQIKMSQEEINRTIFYDDNGDSYKVENLQLGRTYGISLKKEFGADRIARGYLVDIKEDQYKNVIIIIKLN